MKDRGKELEAYNGNYSSIPELPCRKHPNSSSVGICPHCLKERLVKLVCTDCGEQRLSSCSCSEISSYPDSSIGEVGSVGRVSFLIENDAIDTPNSSSKQHTTKGNREEGIILKRSSSTRVEIKRSRSGSGFWRIGKLFMKKREKDFEKSADHGIDEKISDNSMWACEHLGVSRSRSLCSFRNSGWCNYGSEDGGDLMSHSGARSSSVTCAFSEPEPRRSGFDGERKDETELDFRGGLNLKCAASNKNFCKLKESDFSTLGDDSGFIDLKLDLSAEAKSEFSATKLSDLSVSDLDSAFATSLRGVSAPEGCGGSLRGLIGYGLLTSGGSCRISVSDRGIKKNRKSMKIWRWIFRQHNARKKDENSVLNC